MTASAVLIEVNTSEEDEVSRSLDARRVGSTVLRVSHTTWLYQYSPPYLGFDFWDCPWTVRFVFLSSYVIAYIRGFGRIYWEIWYPWECGTGDLSSTRKLTQLSLTIRVTTSYYLLIADIKGWHLPSLYKHKLLHRGGGKHLRSFCNANPKTWLTSGGHPSMWRQVI